MNRDLMKASKTHVAMYDNNPKAVFGVAEAHCLSLGSLSWGVTRMARDFRQQEEHAHDVLADPFLARQYFIVTRNEYVKEFVLDYLWAKTR